MLTSVLKALVKKTKNDMSALNSAMQHFKIYSLN